MLFFSRLQEISLLSKGTCKLKTISVFIHGTIAQFHCVDMQSAQRAWTQSMTKNESDRADSYPLQSVGDDIEKQGTTIHDSSTKSFPKTASHAKRIRRETRYDLISWKCQASVWRSASVWVRSWRADITSDLLRESEGEWGSSCVSHQVDSLQNKIVLWNKDYSLSRLNRHLGNAQRNFSKSFPLLFG